MLRYLGPERDMVMAKAAQPTSALADRMRTAFRRRLSRLWHSEYWIALCLDVGGYDPPADGPDGVTFRQAHASELDSLADMARHMGPGARSILAQQFVCPRDITLIGTNTETGGLVFHVWLSNEDVGLKVLGDWTSRPAVSLRRAWVDPSRRGTGIATFAFKMLLGAASTDGDGRRSHP